MDESEKIIASLRKQLSDAHRKISALEQENALLSHQLSGMDKKKLSFLKKK